MIDLDTMTLPNSLTQSGLVLGLVYQASLALIPSGDRLAFPSLILFGIGGAVLGIWLLDIMRIAGRIFLHKEAMGGGDPKLAAMMGMWLGWQNILLTILIASAIGTIAGAIAMLTKSLDKQQPIPFGPFLAIGGALSLFFGNAIISTYLGWYGLT